MIIQRKEIKETEFYKRSHRVVKPMLLTFGNRKAIQDGIERVGEIGIDDWMMETTSKNIEIVQELTNKNKH